MVQLGELPRCWRRFPWAGSSSLTSFPEIIPQQQAGTSPLCHLSLFSRCCFLRLLLSFLCLSGSFGGDPRECSLKAGILVSLSSLG